MKLGTVIPYLKKIQKMSRDTPLEFCWHQHFFSPETSNFVISRNTDIDFILILLALFVSLRVVLINMVAIFYDVIISVHDVTSKILSLYSNCIANVFMWPKFGNSNISMREVITSFLYGFDQKNQFISVAEGLTLKVRKFWELIRAFIEVTGEKLVG